MKRPNILFIISDQHRADALGCAGHPWLETPNLDRLAERGVRYTRAYSANPLCVPSRMTMMTGQSSDRIRVWGNGNVLDTTIPTFAHGLGAAGYEAVLSGKMHFCGPDQFHGFESRLTGECTEGLLDEEVRASASGERWTANNAYALRASGPGRQGFQYFDHRVAEDSAEFIRSHAGAERPWCLVSGFICPHNPYVCRPELFEKYLPLVRASTVEERESMLVAQPYLRCFLEKQNLTDVSDEQHCRALAAYFGLCTELDENIGSILEVLEESGQLDNTVVIYASDHGDMTGDAGLWFKTNLSEPSARVPFIVAAPDTTVPGTVCDEVVSLLDIAPTLLDLADAPPLPKAQGVSLVKSFREGVPIARSDDFVWAESIGVEGCRHVFGLWTGHWKYVYVPELGHEHLFDLDADPCEHHDLAASQPKLMEEMRARRDSVWSYEESRAGLTDYNTRIRYLRGCGHAFIPQLELPELETPPEWTRFSLPVA